VDLFIYLFFLAFALHSLNYSLLHVGQVPLLVCSVRVLIVTIFVITAALNSPDSKDTDIQLITDAIVECLFSMLVTTGEYWNG